MALYSRNMHQTATYWALTGVDGYGQSEFAAPVSIECRWQDKAVLFRNPKGQEMTSSSIVYSSTDVGVKGYLKLGVDATASPIAVSDAYEIQQKQLSPSLNNDLSLLKVFL